jgi:hypothetical protein
VVTEPQLIKTHPQAAPDVTAEATLPGLSPANPATPAPATRDGDPRQSDLQHGAAGHAGSNGGSSSSNGFSPANAFDRNGVAGDSGFPGLPPVAMRPAPIDPPPIDPAQIDSGHIDSGQPNPPQQPSLDQRPRLHLGLGNGGNGRDGDSGHPNGAVTITPPQPSHPDQHSMIGFDPLPEARGGPVGNRHSYPQPMAQRHGGGEHHQPGRAAPPPRPYDQPRHGYSQPDQHHRPGGAARDASGSYIDQELRARVDGDIAAFLSAFDAALAQDTQDSRSALREATDRLLRAGARTRIELERLEARVPLPPRDAAARSEPAWQAR